MRYASNKSVVLTTTNDTFLIGTCHFLWLAMRHNGIEFAHEAL